MCDGDGTTCTEIVDTIPKTIGSSHQSVFVIGAGLNDGNETVCVLHDPDTGDMVVNSTGSHVKI